MRGTAVNQAIVKNTDIINDSYIKSEIYKLIRNAVKQAKIGKVWSRGMYSYMIVDPYALAQWAMFRKKDDVTGLIPAHHVFSQYWRDKNVDEINACRSPMTDISEHNILTVCGEYTEHYEKMKEYFKYINSGIIYSIRDLSTVIHSDSDEDGDVVLTTDSEPLCRCVWRDNKGNMIPPILYDKGLNQAEPKEYTMKSAVEADAKGFGNRVGHYSNKTTSLFSMLPLYEGEDRDTIIDYIKALRVIIGEEIDSTKSGVKPKLPPVLSYDKIKKEDIGSDEVIQNKIEHNRLVPKYYPYFFRYLYKGCNNKFTKYQSYMSIMCQHLLFMTLDKLLSIPEYELTPEQMEFKKLYNDSCPLLLTPCTMNKLCWSMEDFETSIKDKLKDEEEKTYILLSYAQPIEVSQEDSIKISGIYKTYHKEYQQLVKKINVDELLNNKAAKTLTMTSKEHLAYDARLKLYEICNNTAQLFSLIVVSLPNENKDKLNKFLWNVFGKDILDVIPESRKRIKAKRDDEGEAEYMNEKYRIEIVDIDSNDEDCA